MNRFNEKLVENYKEIESRPCKDTEKTHKFGNMDRIHYIEKALRREGSPYKEVAGKNYYKLYAQMPLEDLAKSYDEIRVVSAHCDNKQSKSSFEPEKAGLIHGCGDNASTVAVALTLMQLADLPKNVVFAMTADEEEKRTGAKKVAEKLAEYFPAPESIWAVVLDVTYGFCDGKDFSFENDFVFQSGKEHLRKIFSQLNSRGYKWKAILSVDESCDGDEFVSNPEMQRLMGEGCDDPELGYGDDDESCIYYENDCMAFSICLPCSAETHKEMHSKNGFDITRSQYEAYTTALEIILQTEKNEKFFKNTRSILKNRP